MPSHDHWDRWPGDRPERILAAAALTAMACICVLPILDRPAFGSLAFAMVGLWLLSHVLRQARYGRDEVATAGVTVALFALAWPFGIAWHLAAGTLMAAVAGATAMALWSIHRPSRP